MDVGEGIEKPRWFTVGGRVSAKYKSIRSDREQFVGGFIVDDREEDNTLVIEEGDYNGRENEYRRILVDTRSKDLFSETENRTTPLGQLVKFSLWEPPWESSHDGLATGWAWRGKTEHQIVCEDVYEFPDPHYMERPADWSPDQADTGGIP